jgi:glycosyltransferase involved in cell wall biosynthesis
MKIKDSIATESDLSNRFIELKTKYYRDTENLLLVEARRTHSVSAFPLKTQNNPLIAVYIPTFNRSETLIDRALSSVLKQTYQNIQILVVDDCSSDDTVDAVLKIKDSRLKVISVPTRARRYPSSPLNHWLVGPVHASNYALSYLDERADWIARIDDDEVWDADHLEVSMRYAINGDFEFVSSGHREILSDTKEIMGFHARSKYYYPELDDDDLASPIIGCTSTWVYRSYLRIFKYNIDCWRKPHNSVNDIDLSVRMFEAGVRMGHTGRCTLSTRPRKGESMIGSKAYLNNPEKTMGFFK